MRHLYGLGTWTLGDAVAPSRQVVDLVIATISQKLIEAGLNDEGQLNESNAGRLAGLLTQLALSPGPGAGTAGANPLFKLQFAPDLPLVAVGAPAASYYPAVARGLGIALVLPPFGEVANAVGSVFGRVSQRVHMTVTQPVRGVYRVFTPDGPRDFAALEAALALARDLAAGEAHLRALQAGAAQVDLRFAQSDNSVSNDIDGHMFFEAIVTAIASGPPVMLGS